MLPSLVSLVVLPQIGADEAAEFIGSAPILLEHRRAPTGMPAPGRRMQSLPFEEVSNERLAKLLRAALEMGIGPLLESPFRHKYWGNRLHVVERLGPGLGIIF